MRRRNTAGRLKLSGKCHRLAQAPESTSTITPFNRPYAEIQTPSSWRSDHLHREIPHAHVGTGPSIDDHLGNLTLNEGWAPNGESLMVRANGPRSRRKRQGRGGERSHE